MSQGITYQDVANAAIALLDEKQHLTLDRIREFLGTGSKSTIARHFRVWKSKHEEADNAEDIPHELLTPLKVLWNQVKAKGDQRIEKVELNAQQEIERLRQQLNLTETNYIELQSSHHHLEEKFHHQVRETEQLQQVFDDEKLAHEKLKISYETLAQQRDEQKDEITRLHQLLNHVQANLEHYQIAMQKLREEQTLEFEKQKTTYERDITELKQENARFSANANHLQRECDQFANQLDYKIKLHDLITAENDNLQQQLQEKIITETTLHHRYDDLQKRCVQHQATIERLSVTNTTHEKNIAVLSNQIENLKQSLQTAHDKIEVLRDEKLFLTQEKAELQGQLKQLHITTNQ